MKQFTYHQEIQDFKKILHEYGIKTPWYDVLTDKGFRQAAYKLHPDRGGTAEEFTFAKNLKDGFSQDIDVKAILDGQIQKWQPVIHKTTVILKGADLALDGFRLFQEPTGNNAERFGTSFTYWYSMYSGFDSISSNMNMLLIARA